jgi:hypothetical protein
MANLLNIVEAAEPQRLQEIPDDVQSDWNTVLKTKEHVRWLREQIPNRIRDENHPLNRFVFDKVTEVDKKVEDLLWSTFETHAQLPVPMQQYASTQMMKLSKTPRASVEDLVEIASRLGFIIVPYEFLNPRSYETESKATKKSIAEFGQIDGKMDVYVLCPPMHYDFGLHVKTNSPNKTIIAGEKNEQAFLALQLTLPSLRAMNHSIEGLRDSMKSMDLRIDQQNQMIHDQQRRMNESLQQHRQQVESQLKRLQEMFANDMKAQAQKIMSSASRSSGARAHQARMMKALDSGDMKSARAALKELSFAVYEPLMFAVPTGTNLRERKGSALLGPCWGPDFEDIVAESVKLKVDKERRVRSTKMLEIWRPKPKPLVMSEEPPRIGPPPTASGYYRKYGEF